jgi:hypothetical protein
MGGRKQKLTKVTKAQERDALLAALESALATTVEQAVRAMRDTQVEIERSHDLLDHIAHLPAPARGTAIPEQ